MNTLNVFSISTLFFLLFFYIKTAGAVFDPSADRFALRLAANAADQASRPSAALRDKLRQPFKINKANQRRYSPHIARIAKKYQVDSALVHAVISAESGYNPNAISPKGAQGLMQLMPATAERFGVKNPLDPVANIDGGVRYLRWLLQRFKNIKLAVAAYNAGEGTIDRYGLNIPYQETRVYVFRVINFYLYYRYKERDL